MALRCDLSQMARILPSGPIQYVIRTIPRNDFPKKLFIRRAPYGFDHFEFRVGQQRKSQLVLHFELFLRIHGIAAAADDRGVQLLEFLERVAKLGRFVDSTWSIRFRIKIEDQVLAAIIRSETVRRCRRSP